MSATTEQPAASRHALPDPGEQVPAVSWPIVGIFCGALAVFALSSWAALSHRLPVPVTVLLSAAAIFVPSRNCWDTPRCRRRKSIPRSIPIGCSTPTGQRIRGVEPLLLPPARPVGLDLRRRHDVPATRARRRQARWRHVRTRDDVHIPTAYLGCQAAAGAPHLRDRMIRLSVSPVTAPS